MAEYDEVQSRGELNLALAPGPNRKVQLLAGKHKLTRQLSSACATYPATRNCLARPQTFFVEILYDSPATLPT